MSNISTWSTTAGNNNTAPPDGWPEGMAPSAVNDAAREMMAAIRTWYEDAEWIDDGKTKTFVASTQFKISGEDVTTAYDVGRRVRVVAATPGTIYGTITASSYTTDTTITVSFDSGSLSNETLTVSYGSISATNGSAAGMGVNISGQTEETTVATDDSILIYDTSATANRRMTVANLAAGTDYVLLGTATASADEYITFAEIFDDSIYQKYVFTFNNIVPTTDATFLMMQAGTGAGPTWLETTTNAFGWFGLVGGAHTNETGTADSSEDVSPICSTSFGTASTDGAHGEFCCYTPGDAGDFFWKSEFSGMNSADQLFILWMTGRVLTSSTAVTSVRFFFGTWSGTNPAHTAETIASGEFRVYGLRNA